MENLTKSQEAKFTAPICRTSDLNRRNEFQGNRLALAFSDGVLDNLPGKDDLERLDVLNDIVRNPAFNSPVDTNEYKPGIILTYDNIKVVGASDPRTSSDELTPKMVRDRIMNFAIWASSGQRKKEESTDNFEAVYMESLGNKGPLVSIPMEYKQDNVINEELYKALPESAQKELTRTDDGEYKFNKDVTVTANVLPRNEYLKLGNAFNRKVPSIKYSKGKVPKSVKKALESAYNTRGIEKKSDEIVLFFDKKVDEAIGNKYVDKLLKEAQVKDPGAVFAKTDGVSVVVASIGS